MSDNVLKAFETAFGVWTTTGYFKHKPTQHQLDGFRKGYAIAEQASADRIAHLEQQLADARKLAAPEELRLLGELLRTQDDQCTADAIFVVERKRIITGFDTDYCESDQIAWCIEDSMHFEGEDYFKELEDEFIRTGVVREDHTRTGFIVHWDFVQLFFTQQSADELISKHGHKYDGELRVSVESAYRNKEFQTVRNWLMSLPAIDAAIKEQQ